VTRLVVNADDLGLSRGVNRGILEAHERGVVTSASLIVDRPAAEEAAGLSGELPLGLHAVLDEQGTMLVPLEEVPEELERQLDRFVDLTGSAPTHVDSHHHIHREPRIGGAFAALADRYDLPLRDRDAPHCGLFYGRWDGESHLEQIGVESLLRILDGLDADVTELGCHPGYAAGLRSRYTAEREHELDTLTDARVLERIGELGIELVSWEAVP
jgi:predicted glycoside hydrolase/deacetylase ChbG (UPF0249 family)